MNILISGGTGFIGSQLCLFLSENHHVTVITRQSHLTHPKIKYITSLHEVDSNETYDIVINLAGTPIADKRWTPARQQEIVQSRLSMTDGFIQLFQRMNTKPKVFISASAIGFYGLGISDMKIEESASGDNSFSAKLCSDWENTALQAQSMGIRTCILRIGIVLGNNGGALKKMLPAFYMGAGGKIGSGNQWMPWIHIKDIVGIIDYCIQHESIEGAINCTAPNPQTNSKFVQLLGAQLKRPTLLNMPALVVKILMGQMGEELLLNGKKVVPKKLLDAGYAFHFSQLDKALADVAG